MAFAIEISAMAAAGDVRRICLARLPARADPRFGHCWPYQRDRRVRAMPRVPVGEPG